MLTLVKEFGGRVEKLPRDWLKRLAGQQKTKPIEIRGQKLIIPAGAAFGTGEHATTAMSLGMLEKLTRKWKPGWSIVDLGTGSGILALGASRLGATLVIGIDNDPTAIATAKENARLNKISGVEFRVGDVRRWKSSRRVDLVTANLFSDLLIKILPKLKVARWAILSGILRKQERDVTRALRRHKIDIFQVRRRGKWVAIVMTLR
jgi:ribosomal protein L11 methyltransferase